MKKFLASVLAAMVVATGALTGVAEATPVACPVGNQGWYEGIHGVYHCVTDGNQLAADYFQGAMVDFSSYHAWLPSWLTVGWAPGAYGQTVALMEFCPVNPNYKIRLINLDDPYWDYMFQLLTIDDIIINSGEGVLKVNEAHQAVLPAPHNPGNGPTGCAYRGPLVQT